MLLTQQSNINPEMNTPQDGVMNKHIMRQDCIRLPHLSIILNPREGQVHGSCPEHSLCRETPLVYITDKNQHHVRNTKFLSHNINGNDIQHCSNSLTKDDTDSSIATSQDQHSNVQTLATKGFQNLSTCIHTTQHMRHAKTTSPS
jgi:hypothetical protein